MVFISAHSPRLYPGNIFHNNDTHTHTRRGELVGNLRNIREEVTVSSVSHGKYPNIDMEHNRIFDTFVLKSIQNYTTGL